MVVGEIGGDGEADDDKLVFYDNTLTWWIVANVTKAAKDCKTILFYLNYLSNFLHLYLKFHLRPTNQINMQLLTSLTIMEFSPLPILSS